MDQVIKRPDAPDHFMVLRPIEKRIVIKLTDGTVVADSTRATRLMESGKTLYDPAIYLPREDVKIELASLTTKTHCPLKGEASYFSTSENEDQIAWSYAEPLDFSMQIKGLISFYGHKVVVEEHPV